MPKKPRHCEEPTGDAPQGGLSCPSGNSPSGNPVVHRTSRIIDGIATACGLAMTWHYFVMISIKKWTSAKAEVHFTFTFSQKILHRRSLLHTPQGVFHRFAKQIYFTVGWAYPYAQPTRRALHLFQGIDGLPCGLYGGGGGVLAVEFAGHGQAHGHAVALEFHGTGLGSLGT